MATSHHEILRHSPRTTRGETRPVVRSSANFILDVTYYLHVVPVSRE